MNYYSIFYDTIIKGKITESNEITWGFSESQFGGVFIAKSRHGICNFQFINQDKKFYPEILRKKWLKSTFNQDNNFAAEIVHKIFPEIKETLNLHLTGTEFQVKIWLTLLNLPKNKLFFYKDIAKLAGYPDSTRAVANAIGKNPLHYIIPCHRIIKKNGDLGGYAAGIDKKTAILKSEALLY